MMVLPSLSQALPDPAKLTSENLLKAFCWRANFCTGGATTSPSRAVSIAISRPATARRNGDAQHRHARRTNDHQLAAAGQDAESQQRADEHRDRHQLVGLLRQIEHSEQQRIARPVVADADVILLADEDEQCTERQERAEHHGAVEQDRADDVAIDDFHAGRT